MIAFDSTGIGVLRYQFRDRVLSDLDYRHWALIRLYKLQTPAERSLRVTRRLNSVGFSAPDAPRLSLLAERIAAREALSTADEETLKARLPKYWKQLVICTLAEPKEIATLRKGVRRSQALQPRRERAA